VSGRSRSARSSPLRFRRFGQAINADKVLGTHNPQYPPLDLRHTSPRVTRHTAVVDSLKALYLNPLIREADIDRSIKYGNRPLGSGRHLTALAQPVHGLMLTEAAQFEMADLKDRRRNFHGESISHEKRLADILAEQF